MPNKPILVVLRIESTNYSTCRNALDHLCELMTGLQFPSKGAVIESEYWKLNVEERLDLLNSKQMDEINKTIYY